MYINIGSGNKTKEKWEINFYSSSYNYKTNFSYNLLTNYHNKLVIQVLLLWRTENNNNKVLLLRENDDGRGKTATVCGGGAAPECLWGKQCTTADALSQVFPK